MSAPRSPPIRVASFTAVPSRPPASSVLAAEVREALAHRRAAGQDFETAWPAVLQGLPPSQRRALQRVVDVDHWRQGFERRGGDAIIRLIGALDAHDDPHQQPERHQQIA
jgi:hypothetical protein